jgi:hypothetical protein
MVLLDLRFNQFSEMRSYALVRSVLVQSDQPRIARHISGEDRGETTG